jgi:integrase
MSEKISVHVVAYPGKKNLMLRYTCPLTGKQITKSAGTDNRTEARKIAAKWEADLEAGRYSRSSRMGWDDFRAFWEQTKAPTLKPSSVMNYATTFNAFENLCRPKRLADLTTTRVTSFATELRRPRKKLNSDGEEETYTITEASVAKHLRCLKAIARWAHRQELLPTVPTFDMPKGRDSARMKGRPITGEELDRILAAIPAVIAADLIDADPAKVERDDRVHSWRRLIMGIWFSGLRLGEALSLRWDHRPGGVSVVLDGRRSVLMFDGAAQKNGKAEAVALAPEAVEFFELTPPRKREGYVFQPLGADGLPASRRVLAVGRRIAAIGKKAGVVTNAEAGRTATAHDLRRAFGYRWSIRVMPATLKSLMRHSSIETTMTYYVGENARSTAAELWAAVKMGRGNLSGNPTHSGASDAEPENTKSPVEPGFL